MMNQAMLVGRLTKDPEVVENESGTKYSNLTIAVPRNYKNADGIYETDFIEITLWNSIAENTSEYCRKGDLIGVRGRIQVDSYEVEGEKRSSQKIVADRITFLSSKTKAEPEPAL